MRSTHFPIGKSGKKIPEVARKFFSDTYVKRMRRLCVTAAIIGAVLIETLASAVPVSAATNPGDIYPWQSTTSLPLIRSELGAAIYNGYLYEVGGTIGDGNGSSQVYYSKINANGTLGPWVQTSSLAICRERHTVTAAQGHIYVIGGNCAGNPQATVQYAQINADGSLGAFSLTKSLPASRRRHTAWEQNGYIFIAGGSNPGFNTVYSGQIQPDGTIASWTLLPEALPGNRFFHSSVLYNGYAYVIGGEDETWTATDTVFYAKVNNDGTTGAWQTSPNRLPYAAYSQSSFVRNGMLYIAGGTNSSGAINSVYYAPIDTNGDVGEWQKSTESLPISRTTSAIDSDGTYIYSVGGYDGASPTSDVYLTRVASPPSFTSTTLPAALTNQAFSATIGITDGQAPFTFSVTSGSLPSGITLNPSTGVLSGTAQSDGLAPFTITAQDATGYHFSQQYTFASLGSHVDLSTLPSVTAVSGVDSAINQSSISVSGARFGVDTRDVQALAPSSAPNTSLTKQLKLLGGISYSIVCQVVGGSATVNLVLGGAAINDLHSIHIFKQVGGSLDDITSQISLSNQLLDGTQRTVLSYQLTDGGSLDEDGLANGVILDPIYIGIDQPMLANTGDNFYEFLGIAIGLVLFWPVIIATSTKRARTYKAY